MKINNIKSEQDFLSRFHGVVKEKENNETGSSRIIKYKIEIFNLINIPKDYFCQLSFTEENGKLSCEFYISGYIPELNNIYQFLDDPLQPFLDSKYQT